MLTSKKEEVNIGFASYHTRSDACSGFFLYGNRDPGYSIHGPGTEKNRPGIRIDNGFPGLF